MPSVSSSRPRVVAAASPSLAVCLGRPSAGGRRTGGLARSRTQAAPRATAAGLPGSHRCTASMRSVPALLLRLPVLRHIHRGGFAFRARQWQSSLAKGRAVSCLTAQGRCLGVETHGPVHAVAATFAWRRATQGRFSATAMAAFTVPNTTVERTANGGACLSASARSATPLSAAHLRR
jgi:hypothetical protein